LLLLCLLLLQVIDKSLEAQVLRSDNSSLARDCRRDMQQLNRRVTERARLVWHDSFCSFGESMRECLHSCDSAHAKLCYIMECITLQQNK
jgi:hypothetical protein